jgi:DNA-directed RNA polymerase specialized sigma24 family protein
MTAFSAADMCQHADAMRRLARDLLRDPALADNAVQQACVTALTRPPAARLPVAPRAAREPGRDNRAR